MHRAGAAVGVMGAIADVGPVQKRLGHPAQPVHQRAKLRVGKAQQPLLAALVQRQQVKFRLQYDRVPAASEEVDTNTIISVIYTLL